MRKSLVTLAAFAVLVSACTGDDPGSTGVGTGSTGTGISAVAADFDPSQISFAASLQLFDSCDAVLSHFQSEALARVGPYGLRGGGWFYPMPFAEGDMAVAEDGGAPQTTAPATRAAGDDSGFSGTNVQVAGVDEPDVVKTDGSRILAFANQKLYYVDARSQELLGSLHLDGWDHRLFFEGDTAIVFARGDGYAIAFDDARIAPPNAGPSTLVYEVDISQPANMAVVRTMRIDGNHLSGRSIDGTIRLVISSYPDELPFVYPSNPNAEDFALEANKQVIRESTIETWLPNYTLVAGTDGEVISSGLVTDCDGVHKPAEFAGFDTLSVLTMSLGDGLDTPEGAAVIAQGETIYASTESLYVATNVWIPDEIWGSDVVRELEQDYETAIHKFDIVGSGAARYVASGSVDGHLLNQFAMDEHEGNLRVATTDGPPWGFDEESESFVTILQVRDDRLEQVGRVGDMGHGERIYSVRFIGDTAYVVTFRQIDPFYVVDLADPEAPQVAGELEISGYSGYLHPIGEDRVLGIGQEATDQGRTTGAKATLFDVSDPHNPTAIGTWSMDGGYSDVEWNHLAFLYWAAEDMVVLPIQNWEDEFSGAVVLETDDGLREAGRVFHQIPETGDPSDCVQLDPETLGGDSGAFFFEPGTIIQVCDDTAKGGAVGHFCEILPGEELSPYVEDLGLDPAAFDALVGEGDRIEVCWPDYESQDPQIIRSLVIGDTLWTLSWRALQANGIADLGVIEQIPLG